MKEAVSCQLIADSKKIQKAFSRAAAHYEELSGLQQEIGLKLIKALKSERPQNILDIGMGTGWLTEQIHKKFLSAKTIGIDFASGMIETAQKRKGLLEILQADARALPFKEEAFDLVISNLVYQWVWDLESGLREVFRTMSANGTFLASIFDGRTLRELFSSLKETRYPKDVKTFFSLNDFSSKSKVREALIRTGFRCVDLQSEVIRMPFSDVFSLLKWLKKIGANTPKQNIFLGRRWLLRTDDFYQRNFKDNDHIYATFEVIWVKAIK